jgi:NADH:ubiquinone oxidoreductase subunit 4 (subunit M)
LPLRYGFGFQGDTEVILRITLNVVFNIAGLIAVLWILNAYVTPIGARCCNQTDKGKETETPLVVSIFAVYYLVIAAEFVFFSLMLKLFFAFFSRQQFKHILWVESFFPKNLRGKASRCGCL